MFRAGVFLVVAGLALSLPSFAQVRTWVSPEGVDTNPCTLQQPCRNFAAGMAAVASGGEVVALSSAGYGPVVINRSVTIVSPEGVQAAIAPTTGTAIGVAGADGDRVVLRHLYLNSQGGSIGIGFVSGAALYVENCTIANFTTDGISFAPATTGADLLVNDTTVRQNTGAGIFIDGNDPVVSIDQVRAQRNGTGLFISSAPATIRRSEFSGSLVNGLVSVQGSVVVIEDSVATANAGVGFLGSDLTSVMTLTRCAATSNGVGIRSSHNLVFVSDSTISANGVGVEEAMGGHVRSRENNTLQANTVNGSPHTYTAD